jgi:hypothetical protein
MRSAAIFRVRTHAARRWHTFEGFGAVTDHGWIGIPASPSNTRATLGDTYGHFFPFTHTRARAWRRTQLEVSQSVGSVSSARQKNETAQGDQLIICLSRLVASTSLRAVRLTTIVTPFLGRGIW